MLKRAFAGLLATVTLMLAGVVGSLVVTTEAQAQVPTPQVWIIGKRDRYREVEELYIETMNAVQNQLRAAYASRGQWVQVFTIDDYVLALITGPDLRCNANAAQAVATATANLPPNGGTSSQQKYSAEKVVQELVRTFGQAGWNGMAASWPKQPIPGTGMSAPILSIVWTGGTQSNFTLVNNTGAGPGNPNGNWTVGVLLNFNSTPTPVSCPG